MGITEMQDLASVAIRAAMLAGSEILDVYCTGSFDVEYKSDNSPLTLADRRAHVVIEAVLGATGVPVLSEEGKHLAYEERKTWRRLWVVDPLDGTREFINKNGEFSVNIALVEDNAPVAGVIYSPTQDKLWFGIVGQGAYMIECASVSIENFAFEELVSASVKLPYFHTSEFVVVATRSHMNTRTKDFLEALRIEYPGLQVANIGSALKFCLLAEGRAVLYPRHAPTSEWDTAAGHALVRSVGGQVLQEGTNQPLVYNKADLENPGFIAHVKGKENLANQQ